MYAHKHSRSIVESAGWMPSRPFYDPPCSINIHYFPALACSLIRVAFVGIENRTSSSAWKISRWIRPSSHVSITSYGVSWRVEMSNIGTCGGWSCIFWHAPKSINAMIRYIPMEDVETFMKNPFQSCWIIIPSFDNSSPGCWGFLSRIIPVIITDR